MCNCIARGLPCYGLCSKMIDPGIKQSLYTFQYGKKFELLHDLPQAKAGSIWTTNNSDPLRAFMFCENGEGFSIERSEVSRWFKIVGEVPPVLLLTKEQAEKIKKKFYEIMRVPNDERCCTYEKDHRRHLFDSWIENFTQLS